MDMLVNCAGMSLAGKFEDLEVSTFEVSKNLFFPHWGSPCTKREDSFLANGFMNETGEMRSDLTEALEN